MCVHHYSLGPEYYYRSVCVGGLKLYKTTCTHISPLHDDVAGSLIISEAEIAYLSVIKRARPEKPPE